MAFCSECGLELNKDAKFCPRCGTSVEQDQAHSSTDNTSEEKTASDSEETLADAATAEPETSATEDAVAAAESDAATGAAVTDQATEAVQNVPDAEATVVEPDASGITSAINIDELRANVDASGANGQAHMDAAFSPAQTAVMAGASVQQQVYDATNSQTPSANEQAAANGQVPNKKKKSKAKIIVPIVIAVILVAAGIGAYFFFGRCYTVSFETDGGSTIEPVRVRIGEEITSPANPSKDGYTFIGWCEDSARSKQVDFPYKPESDCTLYAKWVALVGNGTGATTYSTDAAAKAALNEYANKLETNSNKLYEFVVTVYNPDLTYSYTVHKTDQQNFNTLKTEMLSSLQTKDGKWLVDKSVITIPASCVAIQSNLVKASELLQDRINIIDSAYSAILMYNDSSAAYTNNRAKYVEDVTKASNNACKDSQAKYDEFNQVLNTAKEQLQ